VRKEEEEEKDEEDAMKNWIETKSRLSWDCRMLLLIRIGLGKSIEAVPACWIVEVEKNATDPPVDFGDGVDLLAAADAADAVDDSTVVAVDSAPSAVCDHPHLDLQMRKLKKKYEVPLSVVAVFASVIVVAVVVAVAVEFCFGVGRVGVSLSPFHFLLHLASKTIWEQKEKVQHSQQFLMILKVMRKQNQRYSQMQDFERLMGIETKHVVSGWWIEFPKRDEREKRRPRDEIEPFAQDEKEMMSK